MEKINSYCTNWLLLAMYCKMLNLVENAFDLFILRLDNYTVYSLNKNVQYQFKLFIVINLYSQRNSETNANNTSLRSSTLSKWPSPWYSCFSNPAI
jgi:hypothetical protein